MPSLQTSIVEADKAVALLKARKKLAAIEKRARRYNWAKNVTFEGEKCRTHRSTDHGRAQEMGGGKPPPTAP